MRYLGCAAIALMCATLSAQTPTPGPQFDVASVKPANDPTGGRQVFQAMREFGRGERRPGEIPMEGADRVSLKNWALLDLIAAACNVRTSQVSGPAWLADQVFDVEAKVPDGTSKAELNGMLQSLLEDRFGLKMHRVPKAGQGFALVVGEDGPKLTPAVPPPAPVEGLSDEERRAQAQQKMLADMATTRKRDQQGMENGTGGAFHGESWRSITMDELAGQLTRLAGAPVVDQTGLTGKYSVAIRTSSDGEGGEVTVFDAVEKLGLKLESRKVTVETVVVDEVSKTPTAN